MTRNGNLETTTDARGNAAATLEDAALYRTTYAYDALNRKISQTLPDGDGNDATIDSPITTYSYDKAGNRCCGHRPARVRHRNRLRRLEPCRHRP